MQGRRTPRERERRREILSARVVQQPLGFEHKVELLTNGVGSPIANA